MIFFYELIMIFMKKRIKNVKHELIGFIRDLNIFISALLFSNRHKVCSDKKVYNHMKEMHN